MDDPVDSILAAGRLSHATHADGYSIHFHTDCHTDTCPSNRYSNANADIYAHTFSNLHAGTARLPNAAGGLHARRSQ